MSTIESGIPVEEQDVFEVRQVTRGTPLESLVGADLVRVDPGRSSSVHRHNHAETVLYILGGESDLVVGDDTFHVKAGDRILVGKGVFHGFRTGSSPVAFLSVQAPPILDEAKGELDLEARVPA